MRRGEFESAWRISDKLLRVNAGKPCYHLPRHLQYVWDGSPLEGRRVLVRCYHGLGDTIQFIRFAPLLRAVATSVTFWVQPALIPLLRSVRGIGDLLPLHEGTPKVPYDVDIEIMELPFALRTTLTAIPSEIPYLIVRPLPLEPRGMLSVGLVWKSGDWDKKRSIPFFLFSPLARITGVTLHILQQEPREAGWIEGFGVLSGDDDPARLARIMAGLDLLITVDTMTAHLAGALGVPVWNLLPVHADWRWMEGRNDSPWYPTMRLFRQQRTGQWEPVVVEVVSELKKLAGGTLLNAVEKVDEKEYPHYQHR